MNLTTRMVGLVMLGLLIVFAAFGFVSMWTLGQSTQRTLHERLLLAKVAAKSIDNYNRVILQQIQDAVSASLLLQGDAPGQESQLLKGIQARLLAYELFYLDRQGVLTALQPSRAGVIGRDLSASRYVAATYAKGLPQISGIVSSFTDGREEVVYLVPVLSAEGQVLGAVGAGFDLTDSQIGGFIEAIHLGETGYAQVVDDDGELLASTIPATLAEKSDHGDRFVALIEGRKEVVRTCHSCHDPQGSTPKRKDVLAFVPMSSASWGVAVRQSEEEALGPTRRLRWGMLGIGTLSLLSGLAFTAIFMRRTLRPVRLLTEGAQRIATGDLSSPIEAKGQDEIGILARTFESMRVKLETSLGEIADRALEAEALYQLGVEISSLLDVDKTLSSVVGRARELLQADVAMLSLLDENSRQIYVRAVSGAPDEDFLHLALTPGHGFAGKVIELGQVVSTADYLTEPGIHRDVEADALAQKEGLRSHLGVPLRIRDKVIGALVVAYRRRYEFQAREEGLLSRLANQAAIVIENARLYDEVQRKEEQRGQLLERVISIQEEERKRIAQELHDDSAQTLSALSMQLESIEGELPPGMEEIRARIERYRVSVVRALEDVRRVIADIRPTSLDDLGLVPAIRWYAAGHLEERGVKVSVESSKISFRLPLRLETALFRVAQEAINNIAKHAECSSARILLEVQDSSLRMVIEDDGRGFDTAEVLAWRGGRSGLGILGMRERVALFDGALSIDSSPGKGTKVIVEVPWEKEAGDGKED
ncbi:MAG: GAF domain-containing protein [Chloroflexi bacterium]|nr:GAF domain-containing protein [Chloroflexota bacterium]